MQDQLAECTQDEEDEDAAQGVGEKQAGAGTGEASARAEEQAGADRAADRDHLQLTRFEALVVALLLVIHRRIVVRGVDRIGHVSILTVAFVGVCPN